MTLTDKAADLNPREGTELAGDGTSAVLTCNSHTVRTLEGALATAQVDLDTWEPYRWVANKWDMGAKLKSRSGSGPTAEYSEQLTATELWQVKVWLKRRVPYSLEVAMEAAIKRLAEAAPKYPKIRARKPPAEPHLLEVAPVDAHFGKLAWAPETGNNYDLKIAERIYQEAIEELAGHAGAHAIERVLFVFGNDFFHIDNLMATTTGGTPQDAEGRYPKIIETGFVAMVRALELLQGIAPVDVLWIPGNHDYTASYHLARELGAWFSGCERITVDCGANPRKYYEYGAAMIGLTHGAEEKADRLVGIMPTEQPEMWARTKHREWHIGHTHARKALKTTAVDEKEGVVVRTLPSLSGIDAWHHKKAFFNRRAAEAYLWSKRDGYVGHFSANVKGER